MGNGEDVLIIKSQIHKLPELAFGSFPKGTREPKTKGTSSPPEVASQAPSAAQKNPRHYAHQPPHGGMGGFIRYGVTGLSLGYYQG